jgi:hypothetical protein
MGTAQQEIPVATLETVHTLQLTTEEICMLHTALDRMALEDSDYYGATPESIALLDVLRKPIESVLQLKALQRNYEICKEQRERLEREVKRLSEKPE